MLRHRVGGRGRELVRYIRTLLPLELVVIKMMTCGSNAAMGRKTTKWGATFRWGSELMV